MKKNYLIGGVLFVTVVCAMLAWGYLTRVVPYWQCGEVYKRYSKVEGVRATYVKDYRLNDTLTVAVTLLEAVTDSGWVRLQEDFELPIIPKEFEEIFCGDSNRVTTKNYPKSVPLYIDGDTLMNDLIAISYYKHSICHFAISSKEKKDLIMHKHYEDNINHDIKTNYNEQDS